MQGNHAFNIKIAEKYGVGEAIIFSNIHYWCEFNKKNNINLNEGKYWTYNTYESFSKTFPYFSPKQIRTILGHLEDKGLIVTGNFNKIKIDKTKWYTVTDLGIKELKESAISSIDDLYDCPNGQTIDQMGSPSDQKGKAIPNINTDININNSSKEEKPKASKKKVNKTDEELEVLFSNFESKDVNIAKTCINNFYIEKRRNDSKYARTPNQLRNWSYQLLDFAVSSNRGINEVAKVWNYIITDSYIMPYLDSVKKFVANYEKYIQKCNTSSQRKGYQKQSLVGSEFDKAHKNTQYSHEDEGAWK